MSKMSIKVNNDFAQWAELKSGCDGGNPDGAIWLCGIEWGGGDDVKEIDFSEQIKNFNKEPERTEKEHEEVLNNSSKTWTFDHNAYKLISVICNNQTLNDFNYYEYAKQKITYRKNSEFFKLNLYPISFKDTDENLWNSEWQQKTGFPTKHHYILWCWNNRFKSIKTWINQNNPPKLIICAGKTLLQDFLMAFVDQENTAFENNMTFEKIEDRELTWLRINKDRTILCVTPFLTNSRGLNSLERINSMGLRIREICDRELGNSWIPETLTN
ncbi:MAG: hypothetical protein ACOYOE_12470 [Chlorobium sp.]